MPTLTNQTAFITGATKGMGLAIAEKLAASGCNLLLAARDEHALEALKMRLEGLNPGVAVDYSACDFADRAQQQRLVEWLENTAPHLDILVNNVGIFKPVSLLDETEEDFNEQLLVNYHTPHRLCRAVGRLMRRNGHGHIFNITSIASRKPVATAGTYTVTKFAVAGLTHVLRDELRPYGVKVTEVIPGATLTSSWEGTTIPSDQFILPEDIAEAIVTCLLLSGGANVDELVITPRLGND